MKFLWWLEKSNFPYTGMKLLVPSSSFIFFTSHSYLQVQFENCPRIKCHITYFQTRDPSFAVDHWSRDHQSRDLPAPANLRSITRISTLQTWCVVAAAISHKKCVLNTALITWSTSVGELSCHLNPDNSSVHFVSVSPPVIIINLPCSGRWNLCFYLLIFPVAVPLSDSQYWRDAE